MQSQMQRQCESQSDMKGFWAENCLGKGLRNSELSFFFFFSFPIQIYKLLCYQNENEFFFLFFNVLKNPQPCTVSLPNPNT